MNQTKRKEIIEQHRVAQELIIKLFADSSSRQMSIYQQDGSLHSGVLNSKLGNGPDILTFQLGKFQSIHIQIPTIHIKWVPKQIPLAKVPDISKSYSNSLWLIQKGHKSHVPFQAALDYKQHIKIQIWKLKGFTLKKHMQDMNKVTNFILQQEGTLLT